MISDPNSSERKAKFVGKHGLVTSEILGLVERGLQAKIDDYHAPKASGLT